MLRLRVAQDRLKKLHPTNLLQPTNVVCEWRPLRCQAAAGGQKLFYCRGILLNLYLDACSSPKYTKLEYLLGTFARRRRCIPGD